MDRFKSILGIPRGKTVENSSGGITVKAQRDTKIENIKQWQRTLMHRNVVKGHCQNTSLNILNGELGGSYGKLKRRRERTIGGDNS